MRIQSTAESAEIGAQQPADFGTRNDSATHDVPRTGGVLCQTMHEYIDVILAMLVKTGKGIVQHAERAVRACELSDSGKVGDFSDRICRALKEHQTRRLSHQRALDTGKVFDR